jgi:hypothetical protein
VLLQYVAGVFSYEPMGGQIGRVSILQETPLMPPPPKEGIPSNRSRSGSTPQDNWPGIPKSQKEPADILRQIIRVKIKDVQKFIAQWAQDDDLTLREACTAPRNLLLKQTNKTLEKRHVRRGTVTSHTKEKKKFSQK